MRLTIARQAEFILRQGQKITELEASTKHLNRIKEIKSETIKYLNLTWDIERRQ